MPEEDLVELKFRLYDGSDIGPFRYSPASTVAMLKERIVAEWPKDKKIAPKAASDVKLINGGKILENNKTVAQCKMPFGELPNGIITMHAVVQPSLAKAKTAIAVKIRSFVTTAISCRWMLTRRRLTRVPRKISVHVPYCERCKSDSALYLVNLGVTWHCQIEKLEKGQ
ncbi:hypothetical protein BUALT_Bualt04G0176200 [Buddleja alternifolia]|uniref:Ubiquitin-like domain-containing protein n=1 Tax=Buddleja alternifolia TaxID=168488 RepID=A0AAV6XPQ7_9LAMI|nr:hypothetical protein BUALT_Bualt04G0176200 [Buddleja alternifolia]